jgi:cytochrome P450
MRDHLPGPRGLAQLGPLRQIFRAPQPVLDEMQATYGGVVGLGWGPLRMAIVGDPALLRQLFATSTESFRWGHKFNVLGFVVGPESLIVSDGPDHKRRRAPVQSAFARRRLNAWIPMIVDQTDAAIDRLAPTLDDDGLRPVDLYPVGRSVVLHVVVRALFGERLAARADEIGERFQRPQDYLESSFVRQLPHPFPHPARARVRDDRRALDEIIDDEIAARRRRPEERSTDVLDALLDDGSLTDGEIRDQAATLMGAGYDTTAASLAWMLWRATLAPGIWDGLRAEADDVLGPVDPSGAPVPQVDESSLAALDLADRVMRETLRLHPAGVISPREAAADVRLGPHIIRKGTLILWSAHLAGRDPGAWSDPLRFDPERFVDLTPEQQAVADQAWVPFGRGARTCIGFALAQIELTLIIARFAQRLDLTPTDRDVPSPVGMVINRPEGGAPFRVALRSSGRRAGSGAHT